VRILRSLLAVLLVFPQVSCVDILAWPGFESQPGVFSYPEQLPAAEVAEQVRCELAQYLREERVRQNDTTVVPNREGPMFLDPNKGAQVQLKLSTDLQGSVSYLGVNLKALGLSQVASLVTSTNNVPSLQVKAQVKSTQTSQVDFILPQTPNNFIYKNKPDSNVIILQTSNVEKPIVLKPDAKMPPSKQTIPEDLRLPKLKECSHGDPERFLEYAWFRLWLAEALHRYKDRLGAKGYGPGSTFADRVCQPKLTISTQFQLLFDVSAGTSILQAIPIILPISGVNVDASPDYTHSIQIIFALRPNGRYEENGIEPFDTETRTRVDACQALTTQNPPASTH